MDIGYGIIGILLLLGAIGLWFKRRFALAVLALVAAVLVVFAMLWTTNTIKTEGNGPTPITGPTPTLSYAQATNVP